MEDATAAAFLDACQNGSSAAVARFLRERRSLLFFSEPGEAGEDGATGLWLAAEQNHVDTVRAILSSVWDEASAARVLGRARQPEGVTALYVASQNGHTAVVEELCAALSESCTPAVRRSVLDTPKATGATPMYIAAQQGHLLVLQCLARCGADVNLPTRKGLTPLMIAAYQGHAACVEALLAAGADATATTAEGKDAIEWATAGAARGAAAGESSPGSATVLQLLAQALRTHRSPQASAATQPSTPPPPRPPPQPPLPQQEEGTRGGPPLQGPPRIAEQPLLYTKEQRDNVAKEWAVFRDRIMREAAGVAS